MSEMKQDVKMGPDDPIKCGCDEWPECTHALYWYQGFKAATARPQQQASIGPNTVLGYDGMVRELHTTTGQASQPTETAIVKALRERAKVLLTQSSGDNYKLGMSAGYDNAADEIEQASQPAEAQEPKK